MTAPPRKVLFVASECLPYAKSGGLADVVAALSKTLSREGYDARIVMPLYASIDRARYGIETLAPLCVHMGAGEEVWGRVCHGLLDDCVPVYFIEHERFFGRAGIYGNGGEYLDNAFRFAFLAKAALQVAIDLDFVPDVFHIHDWQSALTAAYLKRLEPAHAALAQSASVLTMHNVEYQGKFSAHALAFIGLGSDAFHPDVLEDYGGINLLKAGIAFADKITTVSPTHAREMLGEPGGHGLAAHLQRRAQDIAGILNGVDDDVWDPESDALIAARYGAADLRGKLECKRALQDRLGLEARADVPLFGLVSRFAAQKGLDLLRGVLPPLLRETPAQVAVLGSGDPALEGFFRGFADAQPSSVAARVGFSEELAHAIEAGADFFLMPSRYEPCGLNQMYSMRYGTLPIVRATGGLADTVADYEPSTGGGTGFVFDEPTPDALSTALGRAADTWYRRPSHIGRMRRAAMTLRFPWDDSARGHADVYESAIAVRRGEELQSAALQARRLSIVKREDAEPERPARIAR